MAIWTAEFEGEQVLIRWPTVTGGVAIRHPLINDGSWFHREGSPIQIFSKAGAEVVARELFRLGTTPPPGRGRTAPR
jgi:hypothetical protein